VDKDEDTEELADILTSSKNKFEFNDPFVITSNIKLTVDPENADKSMTFSTQLVELLISHKFN